METQSKCSLGFLDFEDSFSNFTAKIMLWPICDYNFFFYAAVSEKPRISGNRRGKLPDKLSDKTNPSEAILIQDLVVDESLDLGSSEKETSTVPIDVSMEDASNEISVKENELEDAIVKDDKLEEAKACDDEKSGLENTKTVKGRLQIQGKWRGVDPVVLFRDDTTINSIRNFYGVSDLFPLDGHLVTRNSDAHHVKRIYYISRSVRDVLKLNFEVGQQLKITSVGLKMFVSILCYIFFSCFFILVFHLQSFNCYLLFLITVCYDFSTIMFYSLKVSTPILSS